MKNLIIMSLTVIMVLVTSLSFAQTGTLSMKDLEGLSNSARQELINKKMKEFKASSTLVNMDPDKAEKWAKIISTTIRTVSKDLSIGVNEFIKTDVGKITVALIVYKVIGDDIRHIVLGILWWFVTSLILGISFRHFHGNQKLKIKDKEGNVTEIKYIPRFAWNVDNQGGSESKVASSAVHMIMFIAITILAWVTIVA